MNVDLHHIPDFQVVQHVRLPLMSPKFLVGTVGSELLIKSDDTCRDLVDEAKNYLLLPQERPLMQGPRTRPRKPIRCGEVLFAGIFFFIKLYTCCIFAGYLLSELRFLKFSVMILQKLKNNVMKYQCTKSHFTENVPLH